MKEPNIHFHAFCATMVYPWSNGVIEDTNNLIKVIKHIVFGYRSFVSFKIRIPLIVNTMVFLTWK